LSEFNEICFLDKFPKNNKILNFIKIRRVGTDLFHADVQAERHDEAKSQKVKAIIQPWTGPEDSMRLRFPDFKTIGT